MYLICLISDLDLYGYLFYNLLHNSFSAFSCFSPYLKVRFFPLKGGTALALFWSVAKSI